METLVGDVKTAIRMLAARPGFTAVAVLTLALGIGANTGVFSVVDALLLRPLPYKDGERLIAVRNLIPNVGLDLTGGGDFLDWRDNSQVLTEVAAYQDTIRPTLTDLEVPVRVQAAQVSAGFLEMLGIQPAQGRTFTQQDERLNAQPIVIMTDRLFRRLFGQDTALQGQFTEMDGLRVEVVGLLQPGFEFPGNPEVELLVPLLLDETRERARAQMTIVQVIGKTRPGATPGQASAELKTIRDRAIQEAVETAAAQGVVPQGLGGAPGGPAIGGPGMPGPGAGPPGPQAPPQAQAQVPPGQAPGQGQPPGQPQGQAQGQPQGQQPPAGAAPAPAGQAAQGGPAGPGGPGGPPAGPGGPGGGPGGGGPGPAGPGMGGGAQVSFGGGPGFQFPETQLEVMPLREKLVGDARPALLVLLGAVGLVLLIACANVANLLLARATARRREMAIRAALGAGRGRITRQLLTESALLGLAGGVAGLMLAWAGVRLMEARMPPDLWGGLLRQVDIGLNTPVLIFTLLISLGTGLLFGLAPALTASRVDLTDPLKEGGGRGRQSGTRGMLVTLEVALAVVLLIGAGLLLRSFLRLQAVQPGFDPKGVLSVRIDLTGPGYQTPESWTGFFDELIRRSSALPGVTSVGLSDSIPLTPLAMVVRGLAIEGKEPLPPDQQPEVSVTSVSPEYFKTMGIKLVSGRPFADSDRPGSVPVAIVSRALAEKFWGDEDPVGRQMRIGRPDRPWVTIVGVVDDVRQEGLVDESRPQAYRSILQEARPFGFLVLRTSLPPDSLTNSVRSQVQAINSNIPLDGVSTMEQRLTEAVSARRFNLVLLGLFAGLALALAGIGLYGVLSYMVNERTREIGIRMAIGSQRSGVQALIIRQGLVLAGVGVGAGLLIAFMTSRLLQASLFGVTTADPLTYLVIPLVLMLVALLSSYLPARRATRVDPMIALRED